MMMVNCNFSRNQLLLFDEGKLKGDGLKFEVSFYIIKSHIYILNSNINRFEKLFYVMTS